MQGDGVVGVPSHHEIMVSNELWPAVQGALRAANLMLVRVPDLPGDHQIHLVEPAYQAGELTNPETPDDHHEVTAAITLLLLKAVDQGLAQHPWIRKDPRWKVRVNRVAAELAGLYQALGEDFLPPDESASPERPRLIVTARTLLDDGGADVEPTEPRTPSD